VIDTKKNSPNEEQEYKTPENKLWIVYDPSDYDNILAFGTEQECENATGLTGQQLRNYRRSTKEDRIKNPRYQVFRLDDLRDPGDVSNAS